MQFGVSCGYINDIGYVTHAEKLGYDFAWFPDSPLMRSNIWAMMAIAAQQTTRIRLGTGLAIPGLRLAPVAAGGIATINRLAPGRVFFGTGTGNTAMRTLGQRPARVAEFREYLRVVRGLLAGEQVEYSLNGETHTIGFQNTHLDYIDLEHPIPIMVGGFGPRAQALAGEFGDGVVTGIPRGGPIAGVLAHAKRGAEAAGRTLEGFQTYALANLLMLRPGETLASERVVAECGPAIMANVHYLVDFVRETGREPPDYVRPIWDEYMAFHTSRDAATRHMALHQSHYSYLDPDEARFITPEIIRNFCIAGHADEIVERLRDLERQGLTGVVFSLPSDVAFRLTEDFARQVIAKL
ncbi:MAG: LLM class flavin-dependent oxidoreductase [Alphaproteobacteria bacterium]|nr:LLM class flavin-dependent oxidoreductase [Alphaproteobacteria bacterium]MCB9931083.1 LLM class flavin-dependent oxidoreductase [Alphaproteobacteria bacterium]